MFESLIEHYSQLKLPYVWERLRTSQFVRNVAETVVTRVVLLTIGMAGSIIVARILGPEGRGLYMVALTLGAIGVQFGSWGIQGSNTYLVAKDPTLLPTLLGNSMIICVGGGSLLVLCGWLFFFFFPTTAPLHGWILFLSLLWIPLGLAYLFLQNLLLGLNFIRDFNKIELGNKIIPVCIVLVLFLTPWKTPEMFIGAVLISAAVCCVWIFHVIKSKAKVGITYSWNVFRTSFNYGTKVYLASLFAFLANRADLFLINRMRGTETAGIYSVAWTLAETVMLIPIVTGGLLFPKLSSLQSFKEKGWFTIKVTLISSAITFGSILFLLFFSKPLVVLLYGGNFAGAGKMLFWIGLGFLILPFYNGVSQLIAALGMKRIFVVGCAVGLVAKTITSYCIIHFWGVNYIGLGFLILHGIILSFSLIALGQHRREELLNG